MLGLNTITLISSRVGSFIKRIVTDGLKMRLPFTSAKPLGEELVVNGDFSTYEDSPYPAISGVVFANWDKDEVLGTSEYTLESIEGGYRQTITSATTSPYSYRTRLTQDITHKLKIGRKYTFSCKFRSSEPVTVSRLIARKNSADPQLTSNTETTQSNQIYSTFTETFVCDANTEQYIMFWMNTYSTDIWLEVINVSLKEHDQIVEDASNNENDAILKTGKCLEFSTGNDHINIDGFNVETNEATFAFWAKPASNTSSNSDMIIDLGAGNRFFISVAENRWKIYQYISGGSDFVLHDPNWKVIPNHWQRVVISIDKNNYASVYRDGTLLTEPRLLPTPLDLSGKANGAIGCSYNKLDNFYIGYLSDIQVYDKAWSSDDATYDYKNPENLVTDNLSTDIHLRNLKAWWHLSEGSGAIAHDSAPLVGGELINNGDFSKSGSLSSTSFSLGWSTPDTDNSNISNGVLNLVNNDDGENFDGRAYASNGLNDHLDLDSGKTYLVTYTILENIDNAALNFYFGSYTGAQPNTVGTHTVRHTQSGGTLRFIVRNASNNTTIKISDISLKEVYNRSGDSYIDPDSNVNTPVILGGNWEDGQEAIPQLGLMDWSKGSNLIEYSEDFSNNYWSKASVTLDSGYLAPDGTLSAYKVTADSTTSVINRQFSGIGSYYRSIWAKTTSGTGTVALMTRHDSTGSGFTITNEWQRFTINSADSLSDYFYVVDFRAGNLDEVILWGAQLEDADSVSAYRRTNGLPVTNSTLIKTPDVEQFTGNKVTRNLLLQSEDFSNNYWQGLNNVTTEGGYAAPDGTLSAYKLTDNTGAGNFANITVSFHPLNISNYSRSIWARTTSGTGTVNLLSRFDDTNSVFTLTDEWQRFDISSTSSTLSETIFYLVDFRGGDLDEVILWGAQLQEGGLTRYFPTYGAIAQETLPIIGKDVLGNDVETRGGTLNLDGTGYAEVMHSTDFDFGTGDFSISAWVKGSYVNQGSSINVIFSSGEGGSNSDTTSLVTHSTNKLGFYCGGTTISADSTFVAGNWYHVVGVRDSGTTKLYVDKVLQAQTGSNTNSITNTENEFIGFDNTTSRFYNDLIDDVQVYKNKALSIEEITQNYNATKSAHTN